ncbi:MAG: YIP1 family protein [Acidobacteria bacterium]|nr:YIP1 family protein [Acidobacteriota bacterium]
MESDAANKTMQETEAPKPKSFFSRLGGVYSSPRSTFREIGQAPRVLVPLIVLIIFSMLFGVYLSRTMDLESAAVSQMEMMVERGAMTKEQMEESLPNAVKFAGIQMIVVTSVGSIIICLILAGYAKLFAMFAGAESLFKSLLSVTIFAILAVSIVQSGLTALFLQLKGPGEVDLTQINSVIASNLGAILSSFLGDDALPKFIMRLATAIDVFTIWMIALLAIGYSVVSRKLKTSTAAFWLGGAYALITIISAAVGSIFTMPGSR